MNGILIRAVRHAVAAVAGAATVLSPTPASAEGTTPPTDEVTLIVYAVNGSGCSAGTITVEEAPDNTSFQVTYRNFVARVGPDARPTDIRKNWQVNLLIRVPQGYTYAIAKVEYKGSAELASGVSGLVRANFYAAGDPPMPYVTRSFNGPYNSLWQATDIRDEAHLIWAPCGQARTVNLNTELRLRAGVSHPPAASFMAMHTADGSARTVYHYAWKRCG